jgi:Kef-type K+ transport system membrane component KefB
MKNISELLFFPFFFFMVGMMTHLFSSLTSNLLLSTGISLIGVWMYFLGYLWFYYELKDLK